MLWCCPFYFFLLLFHILQIQYFQLYRNSVLVKIWYLTEKPALLSAVLGFPLAKALSLGSQTLGSSSYAKGAARTDPHIHVDSSLKSMLLIREEWIKVFLLPFAKGIQNVKDHLLPDFLFRTKINRSTYIQVRAYKKINEIVTIDLGNIIYD